MKFRLAAVAAAVAATLALAACGGGGNDGNSFAPIGVLPSPPPAPAPPPAEPPAPAPAPVPAASTFLYEQVPYPADGAAFLNDLNNEGAKGFRFLGPLGSAPSAANVYVKTGSTTYVYETQSEPANSSAFLSQANDAGSRGFRWVGMTSANGVAVMMYRKDSGSDATYTYRTEGPASNKADYISRGNAQGSEGYYNTAPMIVFGSSTVSVFEKSSVGNSTFAYEVLDPAGDTAGALAQFTEEGARGFRYRGPFGFGNIFAKDLSQSSTFTYQALTPESTLAGLIEQANTVGANGFGFIGPLNVGSESRMYFYKAADCTGAALCMPTGPFGI
jgi:hypothetical protein